MKKRILGACAIALAFCLLVGCGNSKSQQSTSETTTEDILANLPEYKRVVIDNPEEYIKLGQYKGLEIEGVSSEVTDKDVEEDLRSLAENYTTYEDVTDRKEVKKGDFVNIDYISVIDGKESDTYSDTDMDIEIGTNELAEGLEGVDFDAQLMGHKVGDSVKVTYTFPDDFYDTDVVGKKCEQTITIKKIQKQIIPEINDAFIKENTDYNTVAEYKKAKKTELEEAAKTEADQTARYNLWTAVVANATQEKDFPEDMISQEKDNLISEQAETAAAYGMEIEDYFNTIYGQSLEDAAKENLKAECVCRLLEKELKIEVTDQDVKKNIDEILQTYDEYSSAQDLYDAGLTDETIRDNIVYEKILDTLLPETKIKIVENPDDGMPAEEFVE